MQLFRRATHIEFVIVMGWNSHVSVQTQKTTENNAADNNNHPDNVRQREEGGGCYERSVNTDLPSLCHNHTSHGKCLHQILNTCRLMNLSLIFTGQGLRHSCLVWKIKWNNNSRSCLCLFLLSDSYHMITNPHNYPSSPKSVVHAICLSAALQSEFLLSRLGVYSMIKMIQG